MRETILKPSWNLKKFLSKIRQMPRHFNMHKHYAKGPRGATALINLLKIARSNPKLAKKRPELEAPAVCHIYLQLFNSHRLRNLNSEEFDSVGRRNTVSRKSGAIGDPWAEQG